MLTPNYLDGIDWAERRDREEAALDALIAMALRSQDTEEAVADWINDGELPELSEEDRKALDSLAHDFIERLLRGERPISC